MLSKKHDSEWTMKAYTIQDQIGGLSHTWKLSFLEFRENLERQKRV
jgi:hypothetical protein